MKIYVKKVDGLVLPAKAKKKDENGNLVETQAAGYDIVTTSDPKIVGMESRFKNSWLRIDYLEYETNLYLAPSVSTSHIHIFPQSSISKYNLVLANSVAVIDTDYRGMLLCRFKYVWQPQNFKIPQELDMSIGQIVGEVDADKIYKKGDAIAQILGAMTVGLEFELVDDLTKTARGEGGFGHTTEATKPILGYNPNSVPVQTTKFQKLAGIVDKYNEVGGIVVKEKYTEELKKRQEQ